MTFELLSLGTSAAIPANGRYPSAHILNINERLYLLDCGEGAQFQMAKYGVKRSKLHHIFITHLHGDHYFGLPGILTGWSLNKRTDPLDVYSPEGLRDIIATQVKWSGGKMEKMRYPVRFHEVDTTHSTLIHTNDDLTVHTLPLRHGIPCAGYLFREQPKPRRMLKSAIAQYEIPYAVIPGIKGGDDYTTPEGRIIPNALLTDDAPPARSLAYCTDTLYTPELASTLAGVDILYHEATFLHEAKARATQTHHTTALQAATLARDAGVGRLVLGHFSARYIDVQPLVEEARTVFPNTVAAQEGVSVGLE